MSASNFAPWHHWRWLVPIDFLTAALVVAACVGLMVATMGTVIDKAQMSNAWFLAQPARIVVSEDIALSGNLDAPIPAWAVQTASNAPRQVASVGAAIHITGRHVRGGAPYTLQLRPALNAAAPAGSLFWLCGAHALPPGWSASTAEPIDLQDAPNWLAPCRAPAGS